MKFALPLALLTLAPPLVSLAGPEDDPDFSHSVTTEKKPWTDRDFKNNPDHFRFAILTDRSGGIRPGVFPRAVRKLNELQPEFVITVGDLIAGRSTKKELREEWKEFNSFLEPFEMPFFYVPGNHDMKDPTGTEVWDEHFGVRHYSFVYKNELFFDADADRQLFHYVAVNRAGVVRDSRRANADWQSRAKVATGGDDRQWTVEIAVPLGALEADLSRHKKWGFQIHRNRPHAREVYQWNPNFMKTKFMPSGYGRLSFP